MSKRQKRKDSTTLAEWCEGMGRLHRQLAAEALDNGHKKQHVRSLLFKSRRFAQIATVLRNADNG